MTVAKIAYIVTACCIALCCPGACFAQLITTIAGNSYYGYSGDGGPATLARLNSICKIAIDQYGNKYVPDNDNHRVRKVAANGIITTFAGTGVAGYSGDGGPATAAQLYTPDGAAMDAYNNVYVAGFRDGCIRKIDTTGIITTVAGAYPGSLADGIPATAATIGPYSLTVDGVGDIYIGDGFAYKIRKIDTSGYIYTIAGTGVAGYSGDGGPATAAELGTLTGIAMDRSGNIFCADNTYQVIRKINTAGIISTVAGTGGYGYSGDGGPATAAEVWCQDVHVDNSGNLYIADLANNRVRKVNAAGIITTIAGTGILGESGDGGAATAAELVEPQGVTLDTAGNIYISDIYKLREILNHNYPVRFAGGHRQAVTVCAGSVAGLSAPLAAVDSPGGLTLYWSMVANPVHGTLAATDTGVSVGDTVVPTGVSYTPATGYSGTDSFRVRVTDNLTADTTTIYVTALHVAAITGAAQLCTGLWATLGDTAAAGTGWSSSNTAVATAGSGTGIVNGVAAGTAVITYGQYNGCTADTVVTILPLPHAITGALALCAGAAHLLADSDAGGLWSSGNTGVAGVGSATGMVTGVSAGTAFITYTLSTGCLTTTIATVNPLPAAIRGSLWLCETFGTALTDSTPGGVWSSDGLSIATIGSLTGAVSGIGTGVTPILYTLTATGCSATVSFTVLPSPDPIAGVTEVCVGAATALSDYETGGTWSTAGTGAGVGSVSGVVTGIATGAATITYTLPDGCRDTVVVSVYPVPAPIGGPSAICEGATATMTETGSGSYSWTSSNTGVATIVSTLGLATGVSAGSAIISYTLSTGCFTTATLAITPPPGPVTGTLQVCAGMATALGNSVAGGTWMSSNLAVGSIALTGGIARGITPGTAGITYSLGGSCKSEATLTVLSTPATIAGTPDVCVGSTAVVTDVTGSGAWSSGSTAVGTISATGAFGGVAAGTTTITYLLADGCSATTGATVNPLPGTIGGTLVLCAGAAAVLTDLAGGGAWVSGAPLVVAIDSFTGTTAAITGVAAGTAIITYAEGSCRSMAVVTVRTTPLAIGGAGTTAAICAGMTTSFTDATTGGAWSSGNTAVGTITAGLGTAIGIAQGTATISYILTTGCLATAVLTVNPHPAAITAGAPWCAGATTAFTDTPPGGVWASSNTAVAAIGSVTGTATGIGGGTALVSYSLAAGCLATVAVTVLAAPVAPGGAAAVCIGSSITVSDATAGGTWSIPWYYTGEATITGSGVVSGLNLGQAVATYTLADGCMVTDTLAVSNTPGPITGPTSVCMGAHAAYGNEVVGGLWSSSAATVATVGSRSGVGSAVSTGTAILTYSLGTGCMVTLVVTVQPLPAAIGGATTVCAGSTALLTDTSTGGTWSASGGATINTTTGTASGISPGTAAITYTLPTGCATSATLSVNAAPAVPVVGSGICPGSTTTATDATAGGAWSGSGTVAAVNTTSGLLTGITAGTAIITYRIGDACYATVVVTVNPLPTAITGTLGVCAGAATTLSDATIGGSWATAAIVAAVDPVSGAVTTTTTTGTAIITYTALTGCYTTAVMSVNPLPAAISGTAGGCAGLTSAVTDATAGGTWLSSDTTVVRISATTGLYTGIRAGAAIITYLLPTGCLSTAVLTIHTMPAGITGADSVCPGTIVALHDSAAGGVWSSGDTLAATISGAGAVTGVAAGVAIISYTVVGCTVVRAQNIEAGPAAITGPDSVCSSGGTVQLHEADSALGYWSSASIGVDSTGLVTGFGAGTATVTFTLRDGCAVSRVMNALPVPDDILASRYYVCLSGFDTLADATPGGTWSTGAFSTFATIGSASGIVAGMATGSATVSYTLSTGCRVTRELVVNPLPGAITGVAALCTGDTALFTDPVTGGAWSSGATTVAVAGTTGAVAGIAAGTSLVSYSITNVCGTSSATLTLTILPLPDAGTISGATNLCILDYDTLTNTKPGGIWTTANTLASVSEGIVYGRNPGSDTIRYTVTNTCGTAQTSFVITIGQPPVPATIIGTDSLCPGDTLTCTASQPGGSWLSSAPTTATINNLGLLTALNTGTCLISYTLSNACGTAVATAPLAVLTAAACNNGVQNASPPSTALHIYPNPNDGTFTLSGYASFMANTTDANIEIRDMTGKTIYTGTTPVTPGGIHKTLTLTPNLPNGIYQVRISTNEGNSVLPCSFVR